MNNISLSEVIATRLSHDLIGNIGAVSNAVELLKDSDDEDDLSDIYNILEFSSNVLGKRLKFFRLCFGLSSLIQDIDELKKIINDYLSTLGNPHYAIQADITITTAKVYKFIMPAVMMMADTLVKGGKIIVNQNDAGIHIEVSSDYPLYQAKMDAIKLILSGEEVKDNPSSYAPLYYLIECLKECNVQAFLEGSTLIIGE